MSRIVLWFTLSFLKCNPKPGCFDDLNPRGVHRGDRWPKGVYVQHFILVDFKGRYSVGSRGVRLGEGGVNGLCRAVPCHAARGGGGASKGLCHGGHSALYLERPPSGVRGHGAAFPG